MLGFYGNICFRDIAGLGFYGNVCFRGVLLVCSLVLYYRYSSISYRRK